jgi:hypothetical protein
VDGMDLLDPVSFWSMTLPVGQTAEVAHFTFDRDGVRSEGRIVCAIDRELALTLSAWWAADNHSVADDLDVVANGVRLVNRVAKASNLSDVETAPPMSSRAPVAASAWASARKTWSGALPDNSQQDPAGRWSAEELAVCAAILGASAFPTVDPEVLAALPKVALDATINTVLHSFVARGLVTFDESGESAQLIGDLGEMANLAVFPDVVIVAERFGGEGTTEHWFGFTPERAVEVARTSDGSRQCGWLQTSGVIGRALSSVGIDASPPTGVAGQPRTATIEEMIGGDGDLVSFVRMRTAWNDQGVLHGRLVTFAIGADGALWSAEQDTGRDTAAPLWNLRPIDIDEVRADLLDGLPGA